MSIHKWSTHDPHLLFVFKSNIKPVCGRHLWLGRMKIFYWSIDAWNWTILRIKYDAIDSLFRFDEMNMKLHGSSKRSVRGMWSLTSIWCMNSERETTQKWDERLISTIPSPNDFMLLFQLDKHCKLQCFPSLSVYAPEMSLRTSDFFLFIYWK